MADWDRSYNAPSVGAYHEVSIVKPAGWYLVGKVGRGTAAEPWVITYVSGAAAANPADRHQLAVRRAGAPERDAYLTVVIGGTSIHDRPKVRDGVSGGPRPAKPTKSSKTVRKASAKKPKAKRAVSRKKK